MWTIVAKALAWVFRDDILKYILYAFLGVTVFTVLESAAAVHGIWSQPWGQWWSAGQFGPQFVTQSSGGTVAVDGNPILSVPAGSGGITSIQERYRLARAAGFDVNKAIITTAESLAENGKGDPALQHVNDDGSIDTGLMQINSRNAPEFGGMDALKIPTVNFHAAYVLEQRAGSFCPWFTYEESCGPHHTGAYRAFLADAIAASQQQDVNPWYADAYAYAQTWLGVPYNWGGCNRNPGIDCSCYVETILAHEHISAPRTTTEQIKWATPVTRAQLAAGDIVFFDNTCQDCGGNPTHEGMYIGDGKMIDAGGTHVQINDIYSGFYADKNPRYGRPRW